MFILSDLVNVTKHELVNLRLLLPMCGDIYYHAELYLNLLLSNSYNIYNHTSQFNDNN